MSVERQKPKQVALAAGMLWGSLALGIVLFLLERPALGAAGGPAWLAWLVPVAVFALSVLLTLCISAGRNWARIVFALMFALGLLTYFPILSAMLERSTLAGALSLAQLVLQAAALTLVLTQPGAAWFRRLA